MKLNKFAYSYSKPLGKQTLKIMKKIPGNLLKKPGKIMEFCQSEKVGTLLMSPNVTDRSSARQKIMKLNLFQRFR